MNTGMNEEKITSMLEGFDLKPDQIDEIMIQLVDFSKKYTKTPINDYQLDTPREVLIHGDPVVKEDWRKRAAIAASIISRSLD